VGMFDRVMAPCPSCGSRVECQTKSGPCCLARYNLEDAPADVLVDVNRHAPHVCEECGTMFTVHLPAADSGGG